MTERELAAYCREAGVSAASIIESTLSGLGPTISRDGRYELGYTLPVPLLKLLAPGESGWQADRQAAERLALTVKETNRPVVLHLFSTHFGIGAPIEEQLAKDPANLSVSSLGPMPKDRYYAIDIYPWSLVSTDNDITRYRQAAIGEFLDAVCRLPAADRGKIRAVTLLGELHHFHADFERGMGVGGLYVVSDYSATSLAGFREFLSRRFGDIAALNGLLGEDFASFAELDPPRGDLRTQRLKRFSEHIDSSAHGKLPLTGWAFDTSGASVRELLNRGRLDLACQMLGYTALPVGDIASALQYRDANAFSRAFGSRAGCIATKWRGRFRRQEWSGRRELSQRR